MYQRINELFPFARPFIAQSSSTSSVVVVIGKIRFFFVFLLFAKSVQKSMQKNHAFFCPFCAEKA